MSIIGGDYEQLTTLRATFDQNASLVQEVMLGLRTRLAETYWQGGHADLFRDAWVSEYEPMLRKLEQALLDAGAEVALARDRLMQAGDR